MWLVNKYAKAILLLSAISAIYWIVYSVNAYNTFHDYNDLASFSMSLYYDLHLTFAVHGLQLITAGNHLSPLFLAFLPIYYIFQSPLVLVIIQSMVVSLTGVLVYIISADLLKDQRLALLLGIMFLLDPGTHGIMIYDFHMEFLVVPLYLLIFYFFMKQNLKGFIISGILLLAVYEVTIFLVVPLIILFAIYGFLEKEEPQVRRLRLRYALILTAMFIVAYVLYSIASSSLLSAYAEGQYPMLPKFLYLWAQTNIQTTSLATASLSNIISTFASLPGYAIYGLGVAFLVFGIAAFYRPIYLLLLALPYLLETFIIGRPGFLFIYGYYFTYIIGGVLIATILGLKFIMEHKPQKLKLVAISGIACCIVLFLLGIIFVQSLYTYYRAQVFLFINPPGPSTSYAQLTWLINRVPANGSLMAPFFTAPHFANRDQPFEMLDNQFYYFVPKYILTDFNQNVSIVAGGPADSPRAQYDFALEFLHNKTLNYSLYAANGTADLFVRR